MISSLRYLSFFIFIVLLSSTCFAQETAASLAEKIQHPLIGSAGISMQFELAKVGKINLIIDCKGDQIRIESPSMLIISNGKTISNYDKNADRVTIDNIGSNSPFFHPSDLFFFSKNYSSKIISSKGDNYTLEFTPNTSIAETLKAAGGIEKLELTVTSTKAGVKILKATATSASGQAAVTGLSIKPLNLNYLLKYNFNFKPKSSTKVIDLRE